MSAQYKAALVRALYGGLILAGVALFAELGMGGNWQSGAIKAGAAFFGYLALRGGIEGEYDTHRNRRGIVLPGDVRRWYKPVTVDADGYPVERPRSDSDYVPPGYSGKHTEP